MIIFPFLRPRILRGIFAKTSVGSRVPRYVRFDEARNPNIDPEIFSEVGEKKIANANRSGPGNGSIIEREIADMKLVHARSSAVQDIHVTKSCSAHFRLRGRGIATALLHRRRRG
jgi:hypothetical protein